jgi:hypothetical protein
MHAGSFPGSPSSKERSGPVAADKRPASDTDESTGLLSGVPKPGMGHKESYMAIGSTLPQFVSSKLPPAANQFLHTAQDNLTTQLNNNLGPLTSALGPDHFGPVLPFGVHPANAQAQDDDEANKVKAAEDRIHHFLVAYPKAHEGDVESFSFSAQMKDMASYMRDLGQISVERKAASDLLGDITRVNQIYADFYDLGLGSASIHRAMKRIVEQYNLPEEERNSEACNADLVYISRNLPGKESACQLLYEELLKYQNRAEKRDSTVEHTLMMTVIQIPLAIHRALNAFMSLRNALRGIFLASSFSTTMVGMAVPGMGESTALIANLFNFIIWLDMLFTHGGESILLSMVGTPDLEQRYEELVVDLRKNLALHNAATKKIIEATKLEIENQVPDDDWNLRHMYRAYLSNWALDSQVFTNPLNDERLF